MSTHPHRPGVLARRGSPAARVTLAALVLALALGAGISVATTPDGPATDAHRLHRDLGRMAKFANRALRPPTLELARDLPAAGAGVEELRAPASTAESELRTTISELRQMRALSLDPHYTPALVAAGRAYLAVSGRDPVTLTVVNPDYPGLEASLAAGAARLAELAGMAEKAAARVKRLSRELVRTKRRARRLEARIERARHSAAARR